MSLLLRFLGLDDGATAGRRASDPIGRIADELDALPADRARFFAAFAYVLARIAGADLTVEDTERSEMQSILERVAGLAPRDASLVVEIAAAKMDELGGSHNYLVTREFSAIATQEEKITLLHCLFAVAAADDVITGHESTEIRNVAIECGIGQDEFVRTRARFRDKLAEFRRLPGER